MVKYPEKVERVVVVTLLVMMALITRSLLKPRKELKNVGFPLI